MYIQLDYYLLNTQLISVSLRWAESETKSPKEIRELHSNGDDGNTAKIRNNTTVTEMDSTEFFVSRWAYHPAWPHVSLNRLLYHNCLPLHPRGLFLAVAHHPTTFLTSHTLFNCRLKLVRGNTQRIYTIPNLSPRDLSHIRQSPALVLR